MILLFFNKYSKKNILVSLLITIYLYIVWLNNLDSNRFINDDKNEIDAFKKDKPETINLFITVCGYELLNETNNLIKSVMIFTKRKVHFIILTESLSMRMELESMLETYPKSKMKNISFEIKYFHHKLYDDKWDTKRFHCGNFRLFIPDILPELDYAIYVDSDCIFFESIENLWIEFENMNNNQLIGMVEEADGYFKRVYGKVQKLATRHGVNSGLMLMDLKKMRKFEWVNKVVYTFQHNKEYFADQGIINILLSENPDKLLLLSCRWNYNGEYCVLSNQECQDMLSNGIGMYHRAAPRSFNNSDPMSNPIYYAFKNYNLTSDIKNFLLIPLIEGLNSIKDKSICYKIYKNLLISIQTFVISN